MDCVREERSNGRAGACCDGNGRVEMKEQQGVTGDGGLGWGMGMGGSGGNLKMVVASSGEECVEEMVGEVRRRWRAMRHCGEEENNDPVRSMVGREQVRRGWRGEVMESRWGDAEGAVREV